MPPHKHTRFYCSCFKLLVCSRCRTCNTYFFLSLCLSVAYNSYPKSQWGCFFCVQDILSLSLLLQNTVYLCTKPSLQQDFLSQDHCKPVPGNQWDRVQIEELKDKVSFLLNRHILSYKLIFVTSLLLCEKSKHQRQFLILVYRTWSTLYIFNVNEFNKKFMFNTFTHKTHLLIHKNLVALIQKVHISTALCFIFITEIWTYGYQFWDFRIRKGLHFVRSIL